MLCGEHDTVEVFQWVLVGLADSVETQLPGWGGTGQWVSCQCWRGKRGGLTCWQNQEISCRKSRCCTWQLEACRKQWANKTLQGSSEIRCSPACTVYTGVPRDRESAISRWSNSPFRNCTSSRHAGGNAGMKRPGIDKTPEGPTKKAKPRQGALERLPPSLPQTPGRGKGVLQMQEPPAKEGSQMLEAEACPSATATAPCGQGGHVLSQVLVRLSIHRMCLKDKEDISVQM